MHISENPTRFHNIARSLTVWLGGSGAAPVMPGPGRGLLPAPGASGPVRWSGSGMRRAQQEGGERRR